jgi:choline/ethanolamine kinase
MNSRNTHLSEYTIKGLICDQYPDWKSLTPNQITLSRLAGLTNITYKAEAILDTTPK